MSLARRPSHALLAAVLAAVALSASACAPEPAPGASGSPSSSTASPSESASALPTDVPWALPAACPDIYSAGMLGTLESTVPPLNDPGITMLSSQIVDALELLESGIPTLRCTWGMPSERGIATNVSIVDAEQAATLREVLLQTGFSEESFAGGTIYRIQQDALTQDDDIVTMGETHFVGDGGWVSTRWIDAAVQGYTEDIVSTVWG